MNIVYVLFPSRALPDKEGESPVNALTNEIEDGQQSNSRINIPSVGRLLQLNTATSVCCPGELYRKSFASICRAKSAYILGWMGLRRIVESAKNGLTRHRS